MTNKQNKAFRAAFKRYEEARDKYLSGELDQAEYDKITLASRIAAKVCEICHGKGNFCNDINGKSVCGLCRMEGYR